MAKMSIAAEPAYKLILDLNELRVLYDILSNIGGSHITTRRKYSDQILNVIENYMDEYEGDNTDMIPQGGKIGIFFKETL